jgi:hypothetical protein
MSDTIDFGCSSLMNKVHSQLIFTIRLLASTHKQWTEESHSSRNTYKLSQHL